MMDEDHELEDLRLEIERLQREVASLQGAEEASRSSTVEVDERLCFQNAILATQMETSLDGILVVDVDGNMVSFNQRFVDIWNISAEVLESRSDTDALQEALALTEEPEGFLDRVKYLYAYRDEKSYDEVVLRDGRILDRYSSPMHGEDGRYYGRVWYFRDITEQQRAALALQSSEEQHRTTLDSMIDAIHVIDTEYRMVLINKTFERWLPALGLDTEPLGKSVFDVFPFLPDDVRVEYEKVFSQGEPMRTEEELTLGRQRIITSTLKIPVVNDGIVDRVVTVIRDITTEKEDAEERKKLETQMLAAQKLESLGLVAGGIAHDFNNLLVAVLGYADLAKLSLPADAAATGYLDKILIAAEHLAELTRQMLAYAGKSNVSTEPIHLSVLVREMSDLLRVSTPKSVKVEYDCPDDLPLTNGDPTQIRQVVLNLMTNASEALENAPGVVSVTTRVEDVTRSYLAGTIVDDGLDQGCYVVLEVTDSGGGMTEQTAARIFDPFFSTKFTGRGLGLAAVLGIVRGHGGAIKVETALGKGTTMIVLLPCRDQEQGVDGSAQYDSAKFLRKRTVLVFDDEEYVRAVAEQMLGLAGYKALTAASGSEGLALFEEHRSEIALVLLDVTMPGMDGPETFDRLRRVNPTLPIVLFSGHDEKTAMSRFKITSNAGFIQKPFDYVTFVAKLREILHT